MKNQPIPMLPQNSITTLYSWNFIQRSILIILAMTYCILFYMMWTNQLETDFYAFHSSSMSLFQGNSAYPDLHIPYVPTDYTIGTNLNPPIFLMLFWPLSKLNIHHALIIWSSISFIVGLISASIAFKLAFSPEFIKKHQLTLYIIYLSLFSTMANTAIAQIGSYLAFFLIFGYYSYRKSRYILAGVLWGIIISIKLFPGLLFFYVLRQRHYKMLVIMAMTVLIMWLIPLLNYGMDIYFNYFKLMPRVTWYGDSWNASIYGFLFRIFVNSSTLDNLRWVQSLHILLALGCLVWYLKKIYSIQRDDKHHQQFCLTLVMMLLISPFSWLYYFPILLFPLLITWSQISVVFVQPALKSDRSPSVNITPLAVTKKNRIITWFMCLFLINIPIWIRHSIYMPSIFEKLSFGSYLFYGLLLLTYLLSKIDSSPEVEHQDLTQSSSNYLIFPLMTVLAFGFVLGPGIFFSSYLINAILLLFGSRAYVSSMSLTN